jgi:rod shape determining protein RodA
MYEPWWKRFDWPLAAASGLLLIIGLAMLASSTLGTDQPYLKSQLLFAAVSLVAAAAILILGYSWLLRWAPVWYGGVLLLLGIVALAGHITRGAASWLTLGPFTLQPSELAKLALILMIAWMVEYAWRQQWSAWRMFVAISGLALPCLALVAWQPDMGTAAVLAVGWLTAVWLSPVDKRILLALTLAVMLIGGLSWTVMKPYQRARITTFLNPSASPLGSGYNVLQSQIAVGSGGWLGRGWGRGTQSHLNFLPEHHTDFIFASLSEEFGFAGAMLVVLLFGVVVWRGVTIAWRAADRPVVILVSCITLIIIFQAGVNMAMNVGLAPVTGIPLPLVSYGGSSLLTTIMCLAVLESVALASPRRLPTKQIDRHYG